MTPEGSTHADTFTGTTSSFSCTTGPQGSSGRHGPPNEFGAEAPRPALPDYIYSRPGAMWTEMGMLTKPHNLWLNWLVEYDDGGYEGGYAWRGRPGTGFAAAHHVVDEVSTARSDAEMVTHFTGRGSALPSCP